MPKLRRRARARRGYTDADILVLTLGHDYFHDSTIGEDLEAMRTAWCDADVRRRVFERFEERKAARLGVPPRPWAAEQFDDERPTSAASDTLSTEE